MAKKKDEVVAPATTVELTVATKHDIAKILTQTNAKQEDIEKWKRGDGLSQKEKQTIISDNLRAFAEQAGYQFTLADSSLAQEYNKRKPWKGTRESSAPAQHEPTAQINMNTVTDVMNMMMQIEIHGGVLSIAKQLISIETLVTKFGTIKNLKHVLLQIATMKKDTEAVTILTPPAPPPEPEKEPIIPA